MMIQIGNKTFGLLHETDFGIDRLQVCPHDIEVITDLGDRLQSGPPGSFIFCRIVVIQSQDQAYRIVL